MNRWLAKLSLTPMSQYKSVISRDLLMRRLWARTSNPVRFRLTMLTNVFSSLRLRNLKRLLPWRQATVTLMRNLNWKIHQLRIVSKSIKLVATVEPWICLKLWSSLIKAPSHRHASLVHSLPSLQPRARLGSWTSQASSRTLQKDSQPRTSMN